MMIAILDYGCGNLHSVTKALEFLGFEAVVTGEAEIVSRASHIILPGVGAFGDAAQLFEASGLEEALRAAIDRERPVLGICLGMQLLMKGSDEHGWHDGLAIFDAPVSRFTSEAGKVPHMGWNKIRSHGSPLLNGIDEAFVYFVHSYRVNGVHNWTAASCEYGGAFTAAVWRGKLFGTQFHPEKSGEAGLRMLNNFVTLS